ncbi:MAG: hypothetical protein ACAH10_05525 [Methylophilaceae bacterium]
MTQDKNRRWLVLGGALMLTLGATAWLATNENEELVEIELAPAKARNVTTSSATSQVVATNNSLPRINVKNYPSDIFYKIKPVEQQADEVTEPEVPPLSFVYTGKVIQDDQLRIFLSSGKKNYIAKQGDILEDVYRIDEIALPNIIFTYLPMNVAQSLSIGGSK